MAFIHCHAITDILILCRNHDYHSRPSFRSLLISLIQFELITYASHCTLETSYTQPPPLAFPVPPAVQTEFEQVETPKDFWSRKEEFEVEDIYTELDYLNVYDGIEDDTEESIYDDVC